MFEKNRVGWACLGVSSINPEEKLDTLKRKVVVVYKC
jgi:hypothetical protein